MEKRVCIIDPLSPYGHKDINSVIINEISKFSIVTVLCSYGLIDQKNKKVKYIQYDDCYFKIGNNSLINRKRLIDVLNQMCREISKNKYDAVIFTSYEVISMYIVFNIMRAVEKGMYDKMYILNHSNIDDIRRSRVKRIAYNKLNKNITNLCYEEYIGNYIETHYNKKWKLLRHNINNFKKYYGKINNEDIVDFFDADYKYISIIGELSFKEKIFSELIELDDSGYLQNRHVKVFIKDKKITRKSQGVFVYNEYLSDNEYSYILDKSHYVLIIYDSNEYLYRISGIFFDAVTFGKPVIYSNCLFFESVYNRFGEFGIRYNGNIREVLNSISEEEYYRACMTIEKISRYYSDINVKNDLFNIIK